MPRRLIGFLAAVVLCTPLVSCDWLRWQYKEGMREDFVTDLRTAVEERGDGAVLDLAEVTTFDWDVVHVVGSYASQREVERIVGSPVHEYELPDAQDGQPLVVFSKEGRVVLEVDIMPWRPCVFRVVDANGRRGRAIEMVRYEARFRIELSERGTCRLEPLNVRVIHNPVEQRPVPVDDVPSIDEVES